MQEAQEIMERYKEAGRRVPSQLSTLQSVCPKIGEDLNYSRSAAYTHLKFSIHLLKFVSSSLHWGMSSDEMMARGLKVAAAICVGKTIVIVLPAFGISPMRIANAALPIPIHFGPIQELRMASAMILRRFGMKGFKPFINALTAFHGRMEHFADSLEDELDQFY